MKSLRTLSVAGILLSIALFPVTAQTIPAADAKNHIGEQATVCVLVASKRVASQSQGTPTFVDLDKSYPNQSLTVLVWERDQGNVGPLPGSGQLCVTGRIVQYRGKAEIVTFAAVAFGKLVWPTSAVCSGPPLGTLRFRG
jgi:hypothetical protein